MKMKLTTASQEETEDAGYALGQTLGASTVVALFGGLGAGKTAFVRGMARALGIDAVIQSPTFTIVNEYAGERELFHFDMYRLKSADELFSIGWEDYLSRGGVCAAEWSENVPGAFDGTETVVRIVNLGDDLREITIEEGE